MFYVVKPKRSRADGRNMTGLALGETQVLALAPQCIKTTDLGQLFNFSGFF